MVARLVFFFEVAAICLVTFFFCFNTETSKKFSLGDRLTLEVMKNRTTYLDGREQSFLIGYVVAVAVSCCNTICGKKESRECFQYYSFYKSKNCNLKNKKI